MQLHRPPGDQRAPQQVAEEDGLPEQRVPGPGRIGVRAGSGRRQRLPACREPAAGRAVHFREARRPLVPEVGGAGEGGGAPRGRVQGLGGFAHERPDRPGGVRGLLGQGAEGDRLACRARRDRGRLACRCQTVGTGLSSSCGSVRAAALHQEAADAAAPQQRPPRRVRPHLPPAGEVARRRAVRLQVEQRGAPAAQSKTGAAVEQRSAGGDLASGGGGQVGLEGAEAEVAVEHAVAALVDEHLGAPEHWTFRCPSRQVPPGGSVLVASGWEPGSAHRHDGRHPRLLVR